MSGRLQGKAALVTGAACDRPLARTRGSACDVHCNSVHPAFIKTPILDSVIGKRDEATVLGKLMRQVPLGRLGEAEDVAKAMVYLASDESRFMTAAEIKLDGGISAM